MWASARRWVAYLSLAGVLLGVSASMASASQCSDVYAGAQRGSPPDWTWWGFGGACHVQWQVRDAADEQRKSALCQGTSGGAYYIHFDSDLQRGRVTCVFSYPEGGAAAASTDGVQGLKPIGKGDFAASLPAGSGQSDPPLEPNLIKPASVEAKSSAGECLQPGNCESAGSAATKLAAIPIPKPAARKTTELGIPVPRASGRDKKTEKLPTDIEPAATNYDDPDPERLPDTLVCSSIALGSQKSCLNPPVRLADGTYVVTRRSGCSGGMIAAIKTTDAKGRCVRKVVQFASNHRRSEPIVSRTPPSILDAVIYRDAESFACYARRHSEISCDGKVNYSPKLASRSEPVIKKTPAPEPLIRRKKPNQPSASRTFFAKVKSLFQ